MDKGLLLALWDYDTWANERILAAAAALSTEELRQPLASGHETLIGTLWHIGLSGNCREEFSAFPRQEGLNWQYGT